jgi:hypothetical protein
LKKFQIFSYFVTITKGEEKEEQQKKNSKNFFLIDSILVLLRFSTHLQTEYDFHFFLCFFSCFHTNTKEKNIQTIA